MSRDRYTAAWVPPLGAAAVLHPIAAQVVHCPHGPVGYGRAAQACPDYPEDVASPSSQHQLYTLWVEVMRKELEAGKKDV